MDRSQSLCALASVLLQDLGNFGTCDFDPLHVLRDRQIEERITVLLNGLL